MAVLIGFDCFFLFQVYSFGRKVKMSKREKKLSFQQSIIAGGAAGFVSGFAFQPFEVLRTRSIGLMGVSSTKIAKDIIRNDGTGQK